MEPINRYSLKDFAERHRADFDLHEPRPELWHALEAQLDAEAATYSGPSHLHLVADTSPVAASIAAAAAPSGLPFTAAAPRLRAQTERRVRWQPLGVLLGALALVLTLGLSRYCTTPAAEATLATGRAAAPQAAFPQSIEAIPASQGGPAGNARLDTAVHGMERYYAVQLAEREAQLSQLDPASRAEWAQDLASLDSIYQQLRTELPQHPQPEAVLTAMNRNLQTRLDILDQQLALRGDAAVAQGNPALGGEYALADSRADDFSRHAR